MHTDIPALVAAQIGPLDEFADRFGQMAPATGLQTAAKLWVGYLRLIDIAVAAEEALASLASFAAEPHIGMRVHHIHTAGLKLSRFLARLGQLRSVTEGLGLPPDGVAEARLAAEVADLRSALQATRSPDPTRFPDPQTVRSVQDALAPVPALVRYTRNTLRAIVAHHSDFWRYDWRNMPVRAPVSLLSEVGIDYTPLKDLLLTGDWQGAHVATKKALCAAAGRAFGSTEPPSGLYVGYMDTLPCADVCTIDKLWRWASAGRFGFAVQLAIYRNLGGTDRFAFDIWQAFCYHTGWIVREPICAISAPLGHLPWLARPDTMGLDSHDALVWSVDCDEEADWRFLYGIFYQRIEHCLARDSHQGA
jgi:hypothetical protein